MALPHGWAALAEQVKAEVLAAVRQPTLDEITGMLNESGIRRSRAALAAAPDQLAKAQADHRTAQAALDVARETYDQAVLDAEWLLDDRFVVEGNKTWLVSNCEVCSGIGTSPNLDSCGLCRGEGETRKSMTADERKAWKASEARKMRPVAEAAAALRSSDEACLAARDAVGVADKRLAAAKHDLDAAVAELNALSLALTARTN